MKIKKQYLDPNNWLLPLTLLSFVGPTIRHLSAVFTLNTRWIFLGLLSLQMLISLKKNRLYSNLFVISIVYVFWCFLTCIWSEMPTLSITKTLAFSLVMFSMMLAGQQWTAKFNANGAFNPFALFVLAALSATFLGYKAETAYDFANEQVKLYQGLAGGPNMLGSLLAMSSPFILWKLHMAWDKPKMRIYWLVIMSAIIFFLLESLSRASLLFEMCVLGGLLLSLKVKRVIPIVFTFASVLVLVYVVAPAIPGKS